jgi:hypothetical protein
MQRELSVKTCVSPGNPTGFYRRHMRYQDRTRSRSLAKIYRAARSPIRWSDPELSTVNPAAVPSEHACRPEAGLVASRVIRWPS